MNNLNKQILKFAVPNILSNISVPLLSSVDTALMGQLSTLHIAAIGIAGMAFNFIYWNMGFLRIGTTGLVSRYRGEGDNEKISNAFFRSMILAVLLSLIFLMLRSYLLDIGLMAFSINSNGSDLVESYFNIRILAAPAALISMVLMGFFFGMQNALYPLLITILVNVVNLIGNLVLVKVYGFGIEGVAISTVIAQYLGVIIALIFILSKYKNVLEQYTPDWFKNWGVLIHFLKNNIALFLRTLSLTLSFVFFYRVSSNMGVLTLAGNTVLLQFLNWMSFGVDGFAHACESILGNYVGKKDVKMIRETIRYSFVWGMSFALIYTFVYMFFGDFFISVFTTEVEVINYTKLFVFWMYIFPLLATPCYIWDGIYVGFMASKEMMLSMLFALIMFLGVYYLFAKPYGNNGLWFSFLTFMISRATFQWWLFKRNRFIDLL